MTNYLDQHQAEARMCRTGWLMGVSLSIREGFLVSAEEALNAPQWIPLGGVRKSLGGHPIQRMGIRD